MEIHSYNYGSSSAKLIMVGCNEMGLCMYMRLSPCLKNPLPLGCVEMKYVVTECIYLLEEATSKTLPGCPGSNSNLAAKDVV